MEKIEHSRLNEQPKKHHKLKMCLTICGISLATAGALIGGLYCYKTFAEFHILFNDSSFPDILGKAKEKITASEDLTNKVVDYKGNPMGNLTFTLYDEKKQEITEINGLTFNKTTGQISGIPKQNFTKKVSIKVETEVDGKTYYCYSPSFTIEIKG